MAQRIDLDHVAIASTDITDILNVLVGEFGATPLFGGLNFGFRAMQLDCGDLRVELMEPWNVDQSDFLQRFLTSSGEGPHHLTFKTDDIRRDLENLREAGYHAVGVNLESAFWQEAFLHPKEAGGTVVQIAQSDIDPMAIDLSQIPEQFRDDARGPRQWWPDPPERSPHRSILRRVVVTTDEMQRSLGLYRDLLGGTTNAHGEGWVELVWSGGGVIRLEHAAGRTPGINRIEWTHSGATTERDVGGARFVLYEESSSG